MTDKLTDKEIVKALEIFVNSVGKGFVFANVDIKKDGVNEFKHIDLSFDEIFDLINRQKAKIEGLQRLLYSFLDTRNGDLVRITNTELESIKKPIKAEAYKEFADRLKEQMYQSSDWSHGEHPFVVEESDIDNTLYELVGDDNGKEKE